MTELSVVPLEGKVKGSHGGKSGMLGGMIEKLPQALRTLRESRGLNQTELAARIRRKTNRRVTPSRVSQWERGQALLSLESLDAILTGLEADFGDLQRALNGEVGEEDEPSTGEPLVDAFLEHSQKRLELDSAARQRIRETFQRVNEIPELVRRIERIEAEKTEEPNGTEG